MGVRRGVCADPFPFFPRSQPAPPSPFFLSAHPPQDPTVHPRWTGDDSATASEDGRLARFARKFEGGLGDGGVGKAGGGGGGGL